MSPDIRVAPLRAPAPPFRSGRAELDEWLARHGATATRSGSARVYLALRGADAVGYLALAAGSVDPARTGRRTRSGMPRYPIPVVLLARMAVSEDAQRTGIGRDLVRHAALLTLKVAGLVAVRALVVDAVDDATAGFYERVGFTPNEANPLRLEILVKDLEALVGDQIDTAPKQLDLHVGDLVEIDGRRYELVPDKQGGLTLEPAVGVTVAELDERHGTRPATQQEIEDQLDLLPGDGEG